VSREPDLPPGEPGDDDPPEPAGRVGPTPPGLLAGTAAVGLVLGWALRPVSVAWRGTAPLVGWLPVLALVLVAAILVGTAWSTHRAVQRRRERLQPHHAVNRLVLAKSCAITGALVGGGYLGYAIAWLGRTDSELGQQRLVHSLAATVACAVIVTGALFLERACRVRPDED
jgi:hypothetical protein